jgi:23S rRNA pseudouridine955/2504/2580 synthase
MSLNSVKKTAVKQVSIDAAQHERRLDNYLLAYFKTVPRSAVYRMIRRGEVRVNGGRSRPEYRLQQGDMVRIPPVVDDAPVIAARPPAALVECVRAALIHESPTLLVLNKPAGVPVHSGSGQPWGIIEVLKQSHPGGAELQLVHRLDRDTSGCLLIARGAASLRRLHHLLRTGRIRKTYLVLLCGELAQRDIDVDRPLRKNRKGHGREQVSIDTQGREARTRFSVRRRHAGLTLVAAQLGTGRTHQIRVHAASLGHPVAGDDKYGERAMNAQLRARGLRRMFLHAEQVVVPADGGTAEFRIDAPLPADLATFLDGLPMTPGGGR